jgi:hypothetical protein
VLTGLGKNTISETGQTFQSRGRFRLLMPEFRYIKLGDDIVKAIKPELQDGTWLIFPTERSCREALSAFQKQWQPLNIGFFAMDEFKQSVVFSDSILLQDEKRLVCLYQAMTPEDREIFHIEKYPDLIDWGQHFFELFEDLAEECVDASELLNRLVGNDFSRQDWQVAKYERMLAIRSQYQAFITAKGYSDAIFDRHISNLRQPEDVRRYVFVNQYYYSCLERKIIEKLGERRKQVIIYYQGKADWLNEKTLKSSEFLLSDAFPEEDLPFSLKISQSSNVWQMALSFLKNHFSCETGGWGSHFVIDARFLEQPYSKVFPTEHFRFSEPCPMHGTRLVHFIQAFAKGLENLVQDKGRLTVKLDWLLQAIGIKGFTGYFRPGWDIVKHDIFTALVCKFSENDVLYLDLELEILELDRFKESDPECVKLLADIMSLLKKLAGIKSIRQMLDVIDAVDGIRVKDLLSEEEKECSNLQDSFYEGLANFMSMDELALVEDWQSLYPNMEVSAGILDLFLTFIKPKSYKFLRSETSNPAADITNLMDTRNLQAEKVTFLNLVEGILPGSRSAVWLFNENQRKAIGLKSWEDIRNWERYYFYRIIASAKAVEIYTLASKDNDVEPSSFLSELHLFAESKTGKDTHAIEEAVLPARLLLQNMLTSGSEGPLAKLPTLSASEMPAFLNLPCDKETDFSKNRVISMSWSACENFIKHPFLYYMRDLKRLRERKTRQEETLGRKMFGILLHSYLNVITQRLAQQHGGVLSMKWEWINRDFLSNNLKAALADPMLYYQIPKNYNREYLLEMLTPFLVDTAGWFFHVGLAKDEDFDHQFITLIPETDTMTELERHYKLLIKPEENMQQLGIAIRGRADLRLETKTKRFIIDFKTGVSDTMQLLFYMWFYYLIEQPETAGNVRAAFYKLMDKQLQWIEHTGKSDPHALVKKLLESIEGIVKNGFSPAVDSTRRKYFIDITRADLQHNLLLDEETE